MQASHRPCNKIQGKQKKRCSPAITAVGRSDGGHSLRRVIRLGGYEGNSQLTDTKHHRGAVEALDITCGMGEEESSIMALDYVHKSIIHL